MERHLLRTLVSIALLVIVAWTGIALFVKLHGPGVSAGLVVLWVIAAVVVVGFAVWNLLQARREQMARRPGETHGR
jgi:cytochrome c-type biogenesis protein CcmH/NrfF